MNEREIYPNAPIVLVVIEIRHSLCDSLDGRQINRLTTHLLDRLPISDEVQDVTINLQPSRDSKTAPTQNVAVSPMWSSRDRRTTLTIRRDRLVIETTKYGSYERVRQLLNSVLSEISSIRKPTGVKRIGLRYIDEIRVPSQDGETSPKWEQWVDPALLGPTKIPSDLSLSITRNEGLTVLSNGENKTLALRYGVQDDYVIPSTPQLRRPLPPPGPLFKLDIDSFWLAGSVIPDFVPDCILDISDQLHDPVHGVFEILISERLREEVLRRA